jgi:NAD(P)H-hydrate repair Nnr-like enzyme with NAD(P)H-hydrate epimerase domain
VKTVEVGGELVVAVGRPDETPVVEPFEDVVDRISVVVAPGDNLGDGLRLAEVVQHRECLVGQ